MIGQFHADKLFSMLVCIPRCLFYIVLQAMLFLLKMYETFIGFGFCFFSLKYTIKQLLDLGFVICKIINIEVRVISLTFSLADKSNLNSDNSAHDKNLKIIVYLHNSYKLCAAQFTLSCFHNMSRNS